MPDKIILSTPVKNLPFVGETYANKLANVGVKTVKDLFYHFPFRYDNFTLVSKIFQLQPGEIVSLTAKVDSIKNIYSRNGKRLTEAEITDDTGIIKVIWFNQHYITKIIKTGNSYMFSGKVDFFGNNLCLISPQYEFIGLNHLHTGRLVPIYPETEGLSSKWIRNRIDYLLRNHLGLLVDFMPHFILAKENLLDLKNAIKNIHFPKNLETAEKARERLAFDELFLIQLGALFRKKIREEETIGHRYQIAKFNKNLVSFINNLPFTLTDDQNRALEEIFADLSKNHPMNRLLEGDVGSGKTIIAAISIYLSFLNGFQSAIMAPTEILANQHYQTISNLLSPLGLKVQLYTSSVKKFDIDHPDVFVGTHTLLKESIKFHNIGLIVIDEQQRFGVEQRQILQKKGINPHLLTMTATPIPRTIALTIYKELEISVLNEMPKGRVKVKTWVVEEKKRDLAYEWIKKNCHQIFIVCPFIEDSESMQSVKAAKTEFENIKKIFNNYSVGLLHGRQTNNEKQSVLEKFKQNKIDILISTPVVEVGIDISTADLIIIEGADRFGLAQLHQLRGRVGRGNQQSYCLLFTSNDSSEKSIKRLKALEKIYNGPRLAEFDLQLRGPGEIFGTKQHGLVNFKAARFTDKTIMLLAQKEADSLLKLNLLKDHKILQKLISLKSETKGQTN